MTDQHSFFAGDVRRRRSDEVELGSTWRAGTTETWTLAWLRETGELYLVVNDSLVGTASRLEVLAVLATESEVDALLEGWQEAAGREDGLSWLQERFAQTAAA